MLINYKFREFTVCGGLLVLTLIGLLLRLNNSDVRPLWLDEIHTYNIVNLYPTLVEMVKFWYVTDQVTDPPLYYIITYMFTGGQPDAPFWLMRLSSVLFGTASIPVLYFLCRRFESITFSLIAAGLMACNTFAMEYSQEFRPYSQLLFFTLLYFLTQVNVIKRFSWGQWITMNLSAIALLYTHYFGGFSLVAGYLVWGATLVVQKEKSKTQWLAWITTPLILGVLFVPVIMYGIHRAKTMAAANGVVGSEAQFYYDQKKYLNFWTDLPVSVVASTIRHTWTITALLWLAFLGMVLTAWLRFRVFLITLLSTLIFCGLAYGFYEAMKYPYGSRRQVGVLPAMLIFQASGIVYIARLAAKVVPVKPSPVLPVVLLSISLVAYGLQYRQYNAGGYRTQMDLVDWIGISEFLSKHSVVSERTVMPYASGSGSTIKFYHNRYKAKASIVVAPTIVQLEAVMRAKGVTGVWYVANIKTMTDDMFLYLLKYGQWKVFYGGALVYLDSSIVKPEQKRIKLLARHSGYYALQNDSVTGGKIELHGPTYAIVTGRGAGSNLPLMPFGRGMHTVVLTMDQDKNLTTSTLVPVVQDGKWISAIDFTNWYPSNRTVDFTLDDKFQPIISMRYNGALAYRFYVREGGNYRLSMRVKNDAPGPIDVRSTISGGSEVPTLSFKQADNTYSIQETQVTLKQGINELEIYYPSFLRIDKSTKDPDDSYNNFFFSGWRLEKV